MPCYFAHILLFLIDGNEHALQLSIPYSVELQLLISKPSFRSPHQLTPRPVCLLAHLLPCLLEDLFLELLLDTTHKPH
jgi:hypothetical protein